MTPTEREEMKRRARAKLAAMRERARLQRRRVFAGAAIAFVVLWLAIFTQMITGNDPALGPATAAVRPTSRHAAAPEPEVRVIEPEPVEGGEGEDGEEGAPVEEALPPVEEVVQPVEEAFESPREEPEELEPATSGQS